MHAGSSREIRMVQLPDARANRKLSNACVALPVNQNADGSAAHFCEP